MLVFRIYWGWVGSDTARFRSFLRGPRVVSSYALRVFERGSPGSIGHNPLAGWGAVLLLALLASQVALGLFAVDVDGVDSGPLSPWVSFQQGRWLADLHELGFQALQVLVAVHVGALVFYRAWRGEDLVRPMLGGEKQWRGAPVTAPRIAPTRRAIAGLGLAAALVGALILVASGGF